jgi:CubicO group peptidase (beta-lactamase class C family)
MPGLEDRFASDILTTPLVADPVVGKSMAIRDLLAHRLGIDNDRIATNEAYTGLIDDDRYYRLLKQTKPTGRFRYSNLNFTLAGRVIEATSKVTWQQFIAEQILTPTGVTHS